MAAIRVNGMLFETVVLFAQAIYLVLSQASPEVLSNVIATLELATYRTLLTRPAIASESANGRCQHSAETCNHFTSTSQSHESTTSTMVGRQRTFELVPTSLVASNGRRPPMTSKQAKKAHQLATRGPKISRAEQRRLDAEELARQKREYEREKAAAKPKAAREKKAAQEQAEREARKKTGKPEPSRFVRPSQPTITRFANKGNKWTWLELETAAEVSDTIVFHDEDCDLEVGCPAKKVKAGRESEDDYGGSPAFSPSELGVVLEELDSSLSSESRQEDGTGPGFTATPRPLPESQPAESLSAKKTSDEFPWDSSESLDDMIAIQLLSEAAAAAGLAKHQKMLIVQAQPDLIPPRPVTAANTLLSNTKSSHMLSQQLTITKLALQERSVNVPPPPLPYQAKTKKVICFAPLPAKPRILARLPPQIVSKSAPPPSSTQVFLEDHLNDFFPSPSQEIRELLDDVDDLPSNTQIARELEPVLPTKKAPLNEDPFADLICTQDLLLSSQDILEITTPCPPASKSKRAKQRTTTPKPLPTSSVPRQPKRRFFEEKDEDLLYAAIEESRAFAKQQEQRDLERRSSQWMQEKIVATMKVERGTEREGLRRTKRIFQRTMSNATDYGEDEFYDCEEELLALC